MAATVETGRSVTRSTFRNARESVRIGLLAFAYSISAIFATASSAAEPALGVQVPEGFEVTLYADDDLAHDIYSMTIDSLGRVVVSGAGYVKILIDADKDGVAESAKTFVDDLPTGAQGMYFLGRDLICAGGEGLIRYRDRNGDDRADGPADLFLKIKTGDEHDLHAIRKGPDGWWYLIAGNASGVNEHYASLPTSPVKQPVAGTVLRMKPDLSQGEVFAHGLRNAYDFDFNTAGDLFTFDSDGERVVSLPWYRPTRFLHVLPGSHQGWVSNDWIRPDHFFDMPPVTASLGRGSPTGVATYRHTAFPEEYHGAIFALDWTYGRVYALPLVKNGSTWKAEPIEFMSAVGQHGFAPTDIEIGPKGEMYVCVGGRGTRGTVYCIRPKQKNPQSQPWPGGSGSPVSIAARLDVCLRAPQPFSSWSRRVWEPIAEDLTSERFIKAALDQSRSSSDRIRALEILTEKFNGIDRDLSSRLSIDPDPAVRARAAWSLGRSQPQAPNAHALTPYLADPDPHVVRAAMEALAGAENTVLEELATPLGQQLANRDRFIRQTAMRLLAGTSGTTIHKIAQVGFPRGWAAAIPVAGAYALSREGFSPYSVEIALSILKGKYDAQLKLEAVRILQLGLGDLKPPAGRLDPVFDGYASQMNLTSFDEQLKPVRTALGELYPTGLVAVDWELERVISMVQPADPSLLDKVLANVSSESNPVADIHHLIVASRIPVTRTAAQRAVIAETLTHLETKIAAFDLQQDSSWADRILELFEALYRRDQQLPVAMLENPDFGLPGHVQFVSKLPPERFDQAVEAFLKRIRNQPDYEWNADILFLLAASGGPEEMELVRSKFNDYALRNSVISVLAAEPEERDRTLYVTAIESTPIDTMLLCIQALQLLSPSENPHENATLAKALRKLGDRNEERQARDQIVELLRRNLKMNHDYVLGREGDPQTSAVTTWIKAVESRFPQEFKQISNGNSGTLADLKQRLAGIDWSRGNAQSGLQIFTSRGCVQCHGKRKAIGPDLAGAAGRFSRDDLFTAIVFPNRDVSPRYQTTQVATLDGQIHTGMIVYEAIDGLVLRDANNQTLRIEATDIEIKRSIAQSLMPAGLLNGLTDQQFADLYAYMQSLGVTSTAGADAKRRLD